MPWKHVWKFQASDGSTWKETWYNSGTGTLAQQFPEDPEVISNRLLLLNPLNKFVSSTISDINNPRVTGSQIINQAGLPFRGQPPNPEPAPDGAANICILTSTAGGQRHWWLRGGDAADYTKNGTTGQDQIGAGLAAALPIFFKRMQDVLFGIKVTPKVVPLDATSGYFYFTAATPGLTEGQTVFTLNAAPVAWQKGQPVYVGLASKKDTPGLQGTFTILAITGPTLTLQYTLPNNAPLTSLKGRVRYTTGPSVNVFNAAGCKWVYNGTHRQRAPGPNSRGAKRANRLRPVS
jgi:hypothetical protein